MATLYAAKGGSGNSPLYTVDPVTGVFTSVGSTSRAFTGLAFDPTSGVLYGATSNNSPLNLRSLVTVNPASGATTLVGSFGIGGTLADIAFKSDGTLYGWASNGGHLHSVNKSTGAATIVGAATRVGSGMGFEIDAADNGYLFPAGSDNGEEVFLIDLASAGQVAIATVQNGDDFPFSGAAVGAASFDDTGLMWLLMNNFGSASGNGLATIDVGGTFLTSVGSGIQNGDALAWQGSVKASPWFPGFTDLVEHFDSAPVV